MPDPVLGHRLSADGVTRPVRLDAAGIEAAGERP